jgi:Domain of unknown function (DUF4397)
MHISHLAPGLSARLARLRITCGLAAVALLMVACGGSGSSDTPAAGTPQATQQGQVRTVNALDDPAMATLSSGSQTINSADIDTPVSEFSNVANNAAMSIAVVAEDSLKPADITKPANQQGSSSAVSIPMTAASGEKVTVFAMGDSSAVRTMHYKHSTTNVPADQTGVRVLHAASRVPTVDIYVSAPGAALPATPTIAALAFANFAPAADQASLKVPQGSYQIRLTTAGSKDVVFDSGSVVFPGGQELLIAALPSFGLGSAVNLLLLPSNSQSTLIREPRSALRAIHLSPDAPTVDVLLGDKRVVRKLAFREDSAFVTSLSGTRTVKVTPADSTATAVITADVDLQANKAVSVVALNKLAGIEPAVIVDDGKAATAGNAKLRVLHASAGVPAVDVYLTAPAAALPAEPAIKALEFKKSAPTSGAAALLVPSGQYRVRLTLAGKTDVVYDSGEFKIKSREDLVVAAIPPKADDPAQPSPVDLLVIRTSGTNSLLKSQASTGPGTTTTPPITNTVTLTTSLRALHASPQAPAVDVLVDGTKTVSALNFGNFSDRAAIAEGTRALKINVAGTSTTVLSATITVAKDAAYTAVAYDTPSSLKALVLKDEVKANPAVGARGYIRIVNLVSDVQGTLTFTGSSTAGSVGAFGNATPYGENSTGSQSVGVAYSSAGAQSNAAVSFTVEQGNFYTVYAVGSANSTGGKSIRLILSRDSKPS